MITHPVRAGACALSASLRSRLMARRWRHLAGDCHMNDWQSPAPFHSGAA
jgi:hypothetical protein